MKVKYIATAIEDDKFLKITKGKKYQVLSRELNSICIYDDCSDSVWINVSKFKISETPQIEVGSEWCDEWGFTCTVLGIGEKEILINNHTMNLEHTYKKDKFLADLKPKPKIVTMYFYKDCKGLVHSYSEPMPVFGEHLFTKEIEL